MQKTRLTTERCELVPLGPEHVEALHGILDDAHVKRFLLDGLDVGLDFCAREQQSSDASFERVGLGLWLARLRGRPDWCGLFGFRSPEGLPPEPSLVHALLPAYTGSGLATELSKELVRAARAAGLERVSAAVDVPNVASRRVLEKAGFCLAGHVPGASGEMALFEHAPEAVWRERRRLRGHGTALLSIARSWDGHAVPAAAEVRLAFEDAELVVELDAPFHGDPAPLSPVGPAARLWEHEVVEVFLAGGDARYLEVELGPHGHHLVLSLAPERRVKWGALPLLYQAQIAGGRWRGLARVPVAWLPPGLRSLNAHAMAGLGAQRRYSSFRPCPGAAPDFHRLEVFAPLTEVFPASARRES